MAKITKATNLKSGVMDFSKYKSGVDVDMSVNDVPGKWPIIINKIIGSGFDDRIVANMWPGQTLQGGNGNDYFVPTGIKTHFEGGSGTDTVAFLHATLPMYVDLTKNFSYKQETFSSIENLVGGKMNDTLIGTGGVNKIEGGSGHDYLDGKGGADYLIGGTGDDYYIVDNAGDHLVEKPNEGLDMVRSTVSWELGDNFENLTLLGAEKINGTGNDAVNTLMGNEQANSLSGLDGNDKLYGAGGNDRLNGDAGNDQLDGGSGNDFIYGGTGQDKLTGGSGDDYFGFRPGESTTKSPDHILDFKHGEDKIGLPDIDADTTKSGNQSFHFVGNHAFSGDAGELRFEKHGHDTLVQGDMNGDKHADFAVMLDDFTQTLTSTDFVF